MSLASIEIPSTQTPWNWMKDSVQWEMIPKQNDSGHGADDQLGNPSVPG